MSATLRHVSGLQGADVRPHRAAVIAALLAEGGRVGMDAGDVLVGIDGWVIVGHQSAEAAFIGDDGAAVSGLLA